MRLMTCVHSSALCVERTIALQGVAADAIEKQGLLVLGARHARQPLGIGELRRKILGLGA